MKSLQAQSQSNNLRTKLKVDWSKDNSKTDMKLLLKVSEDFWNLVIKRIRILNVCDLKGVSLAGKLKQSNEDINLNFISRYTFSQLELRTQFVSHRSEK